MIAEKPVNKHNFLRWYPAIGEALPLVAPLAIATPPGPGLPNIRYKPRRVFSALPVVFNDQLNFIINSMAPIAAGAPETLRLGLLDCLALIPLPAATIGAAPGIFEPEKSHLYGAVTIPNLPDKEYNFVIYNTNNEILLVSNPIKVINYHNWREQTVTLEYTNTFDLQGYLYSLYPAGFVNRFRVYASIEQPKYEEDIEEYTDSNNVTRTTYQGISKNYVFATAWIEENNYDAFFNLFMHDYLFIDNRPYRKTDALEPEYFYPYPYFLASTKITDLEESLNTKFC